MLTSTIDKLISMLKLEGLERGCGRRQA